MIDALTSFRFGHDGVFAREWHRGCLASSPTFTIDEVPVSLRCLVVTAVMLVVGCSDATNLTNPVPQATVPTPVRARFNVATFASIHTVPNLDGPNVTVTAFNNSDVIAGYVMNGSTPTIFRAKGAVHFFTPPAGYLPNLGGEAYGVGIDLVGNVASALVSDTAYRGFIWTKTNHTYLLTPTYPFVGSFVGPDGCGAFAMSPHGYITGYCNPFLDFYIAEWGPGHGLDTIKTSCCGSIDGFGLAISDDQYIAGYILNFGPPQAFRWTHGNPGFDAIGFWNGNPQVSTGLAVNNRGVVAGWGIVDQVGQDTAAMLWPDIQTATKLTDYGQATGVDFRDVVVGWHRTGPGAPSVAFIRTAELGVLDLPGLPGGGPSAAVAINSIRQILGWATDSTGLKRTVIWQF